MTTFNKNWENLDLTTEELERVSSALKNDEFKKLFFDYCQELQDPENRKRYEEEITQLEAERGVEVTFLNPEPGFVAKTSADGKMKAFINIAKSDHIGKPKSHEAKDPSSGQTGLTWSLPLAQAPPRRDFDNKGEPCDVYDVLFHPDAHSLSEKDSRFRKFVIDTACDAVEREFKVKLDRANLKFPKLKFKGVQRPIVVRKLSQTPQDMQASPIDAIYPPLPKTGDEVPKVYSTNERSAELYATPTYSIKHRRAVDMLEMTYELDAKLNTTVPKELVVEIDLPLLRSSANCTLDVTERRLFLISEKPAKYKLCVDLPFSVNDKEGSAKFDQATRKLIIVLPVCKFQERKLKDLYREDSGVESDVKEENGSISPNIEVNPIVEILNSQDFQDGTQKNELQTSEEAEQFLKDTINYCMPPHFDCNTLDENLAFTLHVRNVDPQSLEFIQDEKHVHLKFTSIGSGYYPVHYAFYVALAEGSNSVITSTEAEAWDNNVILTLLLKNNQYLKTYSAGLNANDLKEYPILEQFGSACSKFSQVMQRDEDVEEKDPDVNIKIFTDKVQIDIKPTNTNETVEKDNEKTNKKAGGKKQKKKNKKQRSLSESSCDKMQSGCTHDPGNGEGKPNLASARKGRSVSESRDIAVKGILKHRSRYGRSISESCSSFEELPFSCSVDLPLSDDISGIPEENYSDHQELSESCKKTVRFSDVIHKQLFRLDSSILGQRKKNQKRKNQKQRALQRRNSEGDSSDYIDKSPQSHSLLQRKNKKSVQHDSGLDLSTVEDNKDNENCCKRERLESESSDIEGKNTLMFHMEM